MYVMDWKGGRLLRIPMILLLSAASAPSIAISPALAQSVVPAPQADSQDVASPPSPADESVRDRAQRRRSGDLSPANEQGDTQRPPPPGLAGDWFGLKPLLADAGIGITGRYGSEAAWNYTGGQRRDIVETGQLDIGLQLDMQKLVGIDGTFQATVTYRRGQELGEHAGLGTLQQVQEVYGRGQTWRLTQFWYEQAILGGRVDMKIGRTSPGEDFAAFSCSFQNLSFCGSQPGNVVGSYWYNWPVSQWGGRFRLNSGDAYVQIAVYEENPRNLDKTFTIGHFGGATGALVPLEVGLVRGGHNGGPVGSYKIGGWVSTANAPDVFLDITRRPIVLTDLPPLERTSGHGVWVNIQQQLTGRSEKGKSVSGLSIFVNATQADRDTATIDSQISVGLFEKGLFPWFTEDVLGVGLARTHVNSRVADGERLAGQPVQGAEYAAELYYGFHPRNWLELRPNLQWVHHAGGYRDVHEVGVVGLKTALTL
jgi:porin